MLAILQSWSATDEVLRAVFAEAASMLNSRPLTHVHTDPAEPEPLTPNHFILGGTHPHRVLNCKEAFDGQPKKMETITVNQFHARWMRSVFQFSYLLEKSARCHHCLWVKARTAPYRNIENFDTATPPSPLLLWCALGFKNRLALLLNDLIDN